jgi:hypothetical protein
MGEPVSTNAAACNVVLFQPRGYVHSQALWDVCRLLHYSLESLGIATTLRVNRFNRGAMNIVLGYHLIPDISRYAGVPIIFYQLEQLSEAGGWFTPQRLEVLKCAREIWDYSAENVEFLKSKGLSNVKLLPLGFHERLRTISQAPKEIDVLFYGSLNDHRKQMLDRLAQICQVKYLFGAYGQERDAFIARSRIILNLRLYPAQILEQARLSYLINNECFVISESAANNPYDGMVVTADYDQIPDTCLRFLRDETARTQIARQGYEAFARYPMTEYLRRVLSV